MPSKVCPMKRNLHYWQTKLTEVEQEVAQLQDKLRTKPKVEVKPNPPAKKTRQLKGATQAPSVETSADLAPSGGIAVFVCFQRSARRKDVFKTRLRWLSWLKNLRGQRKLRKRLQMLLTTKIPYYREQIARRTSRTAFDAIQTQLY